MLPACRRLRAEENGNQSSRFHENRIQPICASTNVKFEIIFFSEHRTFEWFETRIEIENTFSLSTDWFPWSDLILAFFKQIQELSRTIERDSLLSPSLSLCLYINFRGRLFEWEDHLGSLKIAPTKRKKGEERFSGVVFESLFGSRSLWPTPWHGYRLWEYFSRVLVGFRVLTKEKENNQRKIELAAQLS